MAARKSDRPRDAHGRFLPKEEAEKAEAKATPKEGASSTEAGPSKERADQEITGPSIGPHTKIDHIPPEERLAGHEFSQVDAMGQEKRRGVVGHSYGPSLARQATLYGAFLVIVVALAFGFKLLADELDQPPETVKAEAPWKDSTVEPAPLDFPRYGNPELTTEPGGSSS